jgi:hypothetical protein
LKKTSKNVDYKNNSLSLCLKMYCSKERDKDYNNQSKIHIDIQILKANIYIQIKTPHQQIIPNIIKRVPLSFKKEEISKKTIKRGH